MYTKSFFPQFEKVMKEMFDVDFDHYTDESRLNYTRPAANIKEMNDRFVIELAVPGFDKTDFVIKVENNILHVSSERENRTDVKFKKKEFNYGKFNRRFTLPDIADTNSVKASLDHGILSIEIMKKAEEQEKGPKNIIIE